METCIRRANKFRAAGADCLFTPRPSDIAVITRLVRDIDGPLNIVFGLAAGGRRGEWIAASVQRVSTGGSMARAALGLLRESARELQRGGAISYARGNCRRRSLVRTAAKPHAQLKTGPHPWTRCGPQVIGGAGVQRLHRHRECR
jgi:2-methylisocitrate lyase-like PEP mutase family enzyme